MTGEKNLELLKLQYVVTVKLFYLKRINQFWFLMIRPFLLHRCWIKQHFYIWVIKSWLDQWMLGQSKFLAWVSDSGRGWTLFSSYLQAFSKCNGSFSSNAVPSQIEWLHSCVLGNSSTQDFPWGKEKDGEEQHGGVTVINSVCYCVFHL